jgi:hypothetical protein
MIHTFIIASWYRDAILFHAAFCNTCGKRLHQPDGIVQRDLAVNDAKQHAAIEHGAKDVKGNFTAWERIEE